MRKLMWFSIGFAAACSIGAYLVTGNWLTVLCCLCLAAAVVLGLLGRKLQKAAVISVIMAGCCLGAGWFAAFDHFYIGAVRQYDDTVISGEIEITDYSRATEYGAAAEGKIKLHNRSYRVQVYTDGKTALAPGDRLDGSFRIRLTAMGGARESTYYQGEGTFLLAYEEGAVHIPGSQGGFKYFPARLRRQITELLHTAFPEDTRGFAAALLLGDSDGIDYKTDTALKLSGIRHIIAVSGLHVAILFGFVYKLMGKNRWLTALFGIPALFLFAATAGFTPSIIRAVIMQALMILALILDHEYDPPTALGFAVLVMLVINPISVKSVSLQLSAGCMMGMFLFSDGISTYLLNEKRLGTGKGKSLRAKITRSLAGSVSVSVSTIVVTAPLSALYFGTVSIVGILTNLLTLWAVSLVFYGVIAVCAASAVFLPAGKVLAWVISWLIRYVTGTASILSEFPMAAVYTNSIYILIWLVFAYVLLAVFLCGGKKRAGLFVCCITVSLLLSVGISWAEARLERYRVTVLDVGQGQSILVQSKGAYYLVDCGGDTDPGAANAAAQALLSQGVNRLDGLILTHYDEDHAGGAELLMSRIRVDALYLPDISDEGSVKDRLKEMHSDRIFWVTEEMTFASEAIKISLYPGEMTGNENESSLCILFQIDNCDILITGDRNMNGERYLLEQTVLPELELLIAGHHGAASSSGFELLAATKPAAVAISVGEGNNYGHPSSEAIRRMEIFGCKVYRTDLCGTIVFRG